MLMLALTLLAHNDTDQARERRQALLDEGFLGRFVLRAWSRGAAAIRFRRALRELNQLDDRELEELGLGRGDLPTLARRHVRSGG